MPGAFAHMVAAEQAQLKAQQQGIDLIAQSTLLYPEWMQAGSVGPDYPYLKTFGSQDPSDKWADHLHYIRTGDVVRAGVEWLHDRIGEQGNVTFQKATSWLAGYLSHVVLDASIHPVVRAIVGEYEEHKTDHRRCEMYQDSHICKKKHGYEMVFDEWADYLRHTTDASGDGMDASIKAIWSYMLERTYPDTYTSNPPDFDGWHHGYIQKIDLADNDIIIFRHAAADNAVIYINSGKIPDDDKKQYIEQCNTPSNNRFNQVTMHYDEVFEFGVENVVRYWKMMDMAINGQGDISLPELPNWNLDKGTTDPDGEGDATLWV